MSEEPSRLGSKYKASDLPPPEGSNQENGSGCSHCGCEEVKKLEDGNSACKDCGRILNNGDSIPFYF